ncbi:MAG: hypothetical protein M3304_01100 [Actinomycetota bacterium]|nr:hypothetical protein [Actinomycetota bacterium]
MAVRRAFRAVLAALVAVLALPTGVVAQPDRTSVAVDRTRISAPLGGNFVFRTTIANVAATATRPLIAHLNILSLRAGVYVDPEDWSSARTRYLGTIAANESRTIKWELKAVGSGSFAAYVTVLAQNSSRPPKTSDAVRIAVEERRTLNSGGILPLALGVPAFVGLMAGGVRLARRRSTSQRD